MFGVTTSDDYKPVAWMGRYPLDVTTLLVVVHASAMVVGALLLAMRQEWLLNALVFDNTQVLQGRVWQLVSYAFVHPPSILFAVYLLMLYWFGRDVERFVGRRAFIMLYAALIVLPSLLLTVWGLFGGRVVYQDASDAHFGVFVAFATIYPSAELILRIQAKWMALVIGAISALQLLAANWWPQLCAFLACVAFAFCFIRARGAGAEFTWWTDLKERFRPAPKFTVVQKPTRGQSVEPEGVHDSIDPILEKISKQGIGSLTPTERKILDRARDRLLKKNL